MKVRGVPLGYVEGLNDARTKLAGFLGILLQGGVVMNAMYALGAVLSLGLLVYLMIALLKAEWF